MHRLCLLGLALVCTIGIAACSPVLPGTLEHDPSQSVLPAVSRPDSIPSSDSLLSDCSGVRFDDGTWVMQCTDLDLYRIERYRTDATPAKCREIAGKRFGSERVTPAPQPFPAPSFGFYLKGDVPTPVLPGSVPDSIVQRSESGISGYIACAPHPKKGMMFMAAVVGLDFDSLRIPHTLTAIAYDGAPEERVMSLRPSDMPLLGRTLDVDPSCELMGAMNLSCFPYGQMNWARFSTIERARTVNELQRVSSLEAASEVLADTTVSCTFEGVETECRNTVFRAPVSKILTLGASNVLSAYYVATEVRGIPSHAVCSFFSDQAEPNGLALLCSESFEVPSSAELLKRATGD